ncbi:MAG: septum formation protein Maf [Chloroflexi bacterium]|nr:septum formation protein Maf [Chloroflexota bacterium]
MLILASASPRRRELLARFGLPFEVVEPQVDERGLEGRPERLARRLAVAKARAVAASRPQATVLAADTVVAFRGDILGKPQDAAEAEAMLRRLRGRSHRVVTAVAVLPPAQTGARWGGRRRPLIDHAVTRVTMRRYSDAEIAASIASSNPFDKAGAYAIQDERLSPVEAYDGCYCNVVGLPLWTALRLLSRAGLDITHVTPERLLPQCAVCPLLVS